MTDGATSIALAIPHTPWVPERVTSLERLRCQLVTRPKFYRQFEDKEANHVWSQKLWQWGLDTGADGLLQLQDDATVAPCFWPALRAMIAAVPDKVIGLHAVHPAARMLANDGYRWHRGEWLYGVGYYIPRPILTELVNLRATAGNADVINEDEFIGRFLVHTKREAWYPIPTIIDHDTSVTSTYGNDDHTHRRPVVTWVGYKPEELSRPEFWTPGPRVPLLYSPHQTTCWGCDQEPGPIKFAGSGMRVGMKCAAKIMEAAVKRVAGGL